MIPSVARRATIAVADLYIEGGAAPIPARILAEYQNCSVPALEVALSKLCKAGILKSLRGFGGGYSLARSAEEIFLRDVWAAVSFVPRDGFGFSSGKSALDALLAYHVVAAGEVTIAALVQEVEHA